MDAGAWTIVGGLTAILMLGLCIWYGGPDLPFPDEEEKAEGDK